MEQNITDLQFALDTFYFLICGALVMWMAAGFSMLEAGLVRAKNNIIIDFKEETFITWKALIMFDPQITQPDEPC